MSPRLGVQILFGRNREPWLASALRSVSEADYVVAVNTAHGDAQAERNERVIRGVVPREKLRMVYSPLSTAGGFAKVRNAGLAEVPDGDAVLLVDADDVHYPDFIGRCREALDAGHDMASTHFYHLVAFRNLRHSRPHREILFLHGPGVEFQNMSGGVHEELTHPRQNATLIDHYTYCHYGYIRPAREVAAKWEAYRAMGAPVHDYDRMRPDNALDDWPRVCQLFADEHPPDALEALDAYPDAPWDIFRGRNPHDGTLPRVGLVLLTWDDEENLRRCLRTLEYTSEPFELFLVDNGSTDGTMDLYRDFMSRHAYANGRVVEGTSLAAALNYGFRSFLGDHLDLVGNRNRGLDYVGWIHPDHSFEWPFWLTELRHAMDEHPEYAKLGASEAGNQFSEPRSGNSQCYLVRRTALERVGLFDEAYEACGGAEDWDHNRRLLEVGQVMIWPDAVVRHEGMSTRKRHDNNEAGRKNMDLYHAKWGTWDPPV